MNILFAVIFGLIEGITEWLPVSSTGHLILVEQFLKFNEVSPDFWNMFQVVIQFGAILAVVILYIKKIWPFTTDKEKGTLRQEVNEQGYKSFIIPDNIGGRYSFITPAHLLPLAINYNLKDIVDGYFDGKRFVDKAFEYAVKRYLLFKNNKLIENFCVYDENMSYFTEWLKQLFGETEGKNGVGIYPTSSVHTRDLHSLGQFVQEGNKIIFETFIKVDNSKNYIDYNGKELHYINNIVEDSVMKAHYIGNVPCLEIELSSLNIDEVSQLIYFFMLAAAFSGYLFGVDPFNQPGVEVYKKEVKESLNNI